MSDLENQEFRECAKKPCYVAFTPDGTFVIIGNAPAIPSEMKRISVTRSMGARWIRDARKRAVASRISSRIKEGR